MHACMQWSRPGAGWRLPQPSSPRCLPPCLWREGCGGDGPFHRDVAAAPRQKRHSCRMHALVCVRAMACALARRPLGSALPLSQQCSAQHHMRMAAQHAWMRMLDAALARPDDRSLQASVVYSFRFSRFRASSARAPSASDLSVTTYPLRKIHSPDTCLPRTPLFRDLARSPCEDRADRFRHERVLAGRCSKHLCAHVQQLSRTQGFETTWTLEPKAENLCGHVQRLTLPQGAKQN
jgi:hypothetical protein